ncbi:MAG: 7-carboxy-7-deazaguanine synthase QueE [Acidimicrobiales bacterium]|nr:7-carboxy-7-deazaguanine synthase QueE [Acidimicrobiales bacterium]
MTVALVVSEVFGATVRGEGPSIGRRCGFVRLGRCNQACTFCDTPYTWDWDRFDPAVELHEMHVADVLSQLDAMDVDMVVVTGGEPLLQQRGLEVLLGAVKDRGWRVEIETAGTIASTMSDGLVDQWNVSPKLANSGNPLERRYKPDVLRAFQLTGKAIFKFVVCEPSDLDEVDAMVGECALGDVWIMPEGIDAATLERRSRQLAEDVIKRGWNLTTRLHILVWGDRRGV